MEGRPLRAASRAAQQASTAEQDDDYVSGEDSDYKPEVESADESEGSRDQRSAKQAKAHTMRRASGGRRGGGIRLESDDESKDGNEDSNSLVKENQDAQDVASAMEAELKRKAELDALFESELGSAPPRPKKAKTSRPSTSLSAATALKKKSKSTKSMAFRMPGSSKPKKPASTTLKTNTPQASENVVEVTKTFDFAGENVTVTKTVAADSREAKAFAAKKASQAQPKSSGLSSILTQMSKKATMSTISKSQLDWEGYKQNAGIEEDLKNHNKDGYLEKVGFMQRAEMREHELKLAARERLQQKR